MKKALINLVHLYLLPVKNQECSYLMLGKSMSLVFFQYFCEEYCGFSLLGEAVFESPCCKGKKNYLLVREKGFLINLTN